MMQMYQRAVVTGDRPVSQGETAREIGREGRVGVFAAFGVEDVAGVEVVASDRVEGLAEGVDVLQRVEEAEARADIDALGEPRRDRSPRLRPRLRPRPRPGRYTHPAFAPISPSRFSL